MITNVQTVESRVHNIYILCAVFCLYVSTAYLYVDKDHLLCNVEEFFKEKLSIDNEVYKVCIGI